MFEGSTAVWNYIESPSINGIIKATGYFLTYIICIFLATKFLPSIAAKSPKKVYRLNGFLIYGLLSALIPIGYYTNHLSLLFIIKYYFSFFIIVNAFAILFSLYLFQRSAAVKEAPTSTSIIDFWNGHEKDPILFGVDLKVFFYQPSLIGLELINVALCEAQYRFYGTVTPGMICYQLFWYLYLLTHYFREDFMLWTFDIIEEHFGFMLVWGDLIYVPYLYSIVGWFIVDNIHSPLSLPWICLTLFIHFTGHYIFRETNWQKFNVRKSGSSNAKIWGKNVKLLDGKLLISGFWGIGRHLNYSGEILVYLSIAMCSGTTSWVPYTLPFSLFCLLSQRAFRDDQRCRKKYVATNGFIINNDSKTVFSSRCKKYESTTNVTIDGDVKGYFVIDYSFTNESFLLNVTDFLATFNWVTLTLQTYSDENGLQQCEISAGVTPTVCTFKLSSTNTYALDFQMDPATLPSVLLSITTSKSLGIIQPNVSPQKPCIGYSRAVKSTTEFCCKT